MGMLVLIFMLVIIVVGLLVYNININKKIQDLKNINQKVTVFYKPLLMGVLNTVVVGSVFTVIAHFLYANSWLSFMFICLVAGIVGYIVSFMIMFNHEEKKNVINKILKK